MAAPPKGAGSRADLGGRVATAGRLGCTHAGRVLRAAATPPPRTPYALFFSALGPHGEPRRARHPQRASASIPIPISRYINRPKSTAANDRECCPSPSFVTGLVLRAGRGPPLWGTRGNWVFWVHAPPTAGRTRGASDIAAPPLRTGGYGRADPELTRRYGAPVRGSSPPKKPGA